MSGGIFRASIHALEKSGESLAFFLDKRLQNGGIELPWVDIVLGGERIFALLNDGRIRGVMIHEAVVNDADFQRQGAPCFHFAPCANVREILAQREDSFRFLASIPKESGFDFKTTSLGGMELRFFRDSPLEPCSLCKESLSLEASAENALDFNQLVDKTLGEITQEEFKQLRDNLVDQGLLELSSHELLREHNGARIVRRKDNKNL